jgi:Zn-finger nucleic acid-binding protein
LATAQVEQFEVAHCQACAGLLIAHRDLTGTLERSWRSVPAEVAEATQFLKPAHPAGATVRRCPRCAKPMETYGYMGLAAVQIDRCDGCEQVWLDADELQNMVLALAKTNHRSQQRLKTEQTQFDPLRAGLAAATPASIGPLAQASLDRWGQRHPRELLDSAAGALLGLLLRR